MRRALIVAGLLCFSPVGAAQFAAGATGPGKAADPVVEFHWAGLRAAAQAGYEGSRTEALLDTMDPAEVADAASRVLAALVRRADVPDLAEGMATIKQLRSASVANPVTVWVNADRFSVDRVEPEAFTAGVRWTMANPAGALALATELENILLELGQPERVSVTRKEAVVTLALGAAGPGPEAPAASLAVIALDLHVDRLWALAEPVLEETFEAFGPEGLASAKAAMAVLDPAGFERVSYRQFFDDGLWKTHTQLVAPAPRRGLARALLDTPALDDADLSLVPAGAPVVAAFGLDFAALWALAREAAVAADPNLEAMLDEQLAVVRDSFGVDLEAGLLNAFGAVHTVFQDPDGAGSSALGLVFTNRLRDAVAFEDSAATLVELANVLVEAQTAGLWISGRAFVSERDGVSMTTVPLPGLSPSWAVVDGTFVLGLYPQSLAAVLDRRASGADSILDNDAFEDMLEAGRDAAEDAGAQGVTSVSYVDLPAQAPKAWAGLLVVEHLGMGLASMTSREPVPAVLPPFARVRPLLLPIGGAGWVEEGGSRSEVQSPFPLTSLLSGGSDSGISTAFALPGLLAAGWEGARDYNGGFDGDDPFDTSTPPPAAFPWDDAPPAREAPSLPPPPSPFD